MKITPTESSPSQAKKGKSGKKGNKKKKKGGLDNYFAEKKGVSIPLGSVEEVNESKIDTEREFNTNLGL